MRRLKQLVGLALTMLVIACGGGGGSAGSTTGSSGGSSSTPVATTATMTLELRDSANASTLSVNAGTTARATLKDASGLPVVGKLVLFSGDTTLIRFTPTSGQALTDANGVASVLISPATVVAAGAGSLNASATINGVAVAAALDYQLSASNVALQSLDLGSGALASFGNRAISVLATVNGVAATNTPIQVTFAASCGQVNPATVTTDNTGKASTTYMANSVSCAGSNVSISASAAGAQLVSGIIAVQAPQATNIQFVSASPQLIYLTGSVGPTQSQLTYKVVDAVGNALQNQSVQLSIVNSAPGVSINTAGNTSPVTLTTDASGQISLAVFSGTVPTSVQVRAVLASNAAVFANSNILTVASGRPVQSAASISVSKFSIEGFNIDGIQTDITMSLADRQGNPVPDGTQVNFVAESGVMIPATCVVAGGVSSCKVAIRSQGTRPANGVVAVLAYTPGEEDFVDANFNNIYDTGETFTDMGNAYRDDNENGAYDTGEFTVPRSGGTTCAGGTNGRPNTCDGVWGTIDVRGQAKVIFATSAANITGTVTNTVVGTSTVGSLSIDVADLNGNSVATGSGISVVVTSPSNSGCVVTLPTAAIDNRYGSYSFVAATAKCFTNDRIDLVVTSPSGVKTSKTFNVP